MENQEPQTDAYRAKSRYKDKSEVRAYDDVRFASWKGRKTDELEKRAVARALAGVPSGSRVLDIPCGTGRITELLLKLGYRTVGADISEEMLAAARAKLGDDPNLDSLDIADAEKLQYADGEFDAVTAIRLMNHIPPDVRVRMLREMARVSRGIVVVSQCNPRTLSGLKRRVRAVLKGGKGSYYPAIPAQMRQEAAQAGLSVSAVFPILGWVSETTVYTLTKKDSSHGG